MDTLWVEIFFLLFSKSGIRFFESKSEYLYFIKDPLLERDWSHVNTEMYIKMYIAMDDFIYNSNPNIEEQFEAKFKESETIESKIEFLENNTHDLIAQDGSELDDNPKK